MLRKRVRVGGALENIIYNPFKFKDGPNRRVRPAELVLYYVL
jgi:hypothetical protein